MFMKCTFNVHEMYIQCTFKVHKGSMLTLLPGEAGVWVVLVGGGWRYYGGSKMMVAGGRTVFVG